MVVTRKPVTSSGSFRTRPADNTSSADAGPSRSVASTPEKPPRTANTPAQNVTHDLGPEFSDDVQFSGSPTKSPKSKGKSKVKSLEQHVEKRRRAGSHHVANFFFLLLAFVYLSSVCFAEDNGSLRCRAFNGLRELVHWPLVTDSYNLVVEHPYVAPQLAAVKPYYERAARISRPAYKRTASVVHAAQKHVQKEWNRRAVPRLRPLYSPLEPYIARAEEWYTVNVAPRAESARQNSMRARARLQPYIRQIALNGRRAWSISQPYRRRLWILTRSIPPAFMRYVGRPALDARRRFVDPHIARIVESLEDLASGKKSKHGRPATEITLTPVVSTVTSETQFSLASKATPTSEVLETNTDTAITSSTLVPDSSISSSLPATATELQVRSTASELADALLLTSFSSSSSSSAIPNLSSKIVETTSPASSLPTRTSPALATASSPVSSLSTDDDEWNDFFSEFDTEDGAQLLSDQAGKASTNSESVESDEEIAERKRLLAVDTAEKRAELEQRHADWERQLRELMHEEETAYSEFLTASRASIKRDTQAHRRFHQLIDQLSAEGEKAISRTQTYLNKLQDERHLSSNKESLWRKVIDKVADKFEKRIEAVSDEITAWNDMQTMAELQPVEDAVERLKKFGDTAQSDLGMDYAWLDDVSYLDWQRYHALVKDAEAHAHIFISMQNGTHPSAPYNPTLEFLDELEKDLDDVIVGFETRLRSLKRLGQRLFTQSRSDTPDSEVSILPLPETQPDSEADDPREAILQRGSEEVAGNLKQAQSMDPHTPVIADDFILRTEAQQVHEDL